MWHSLASGSGFARGLSCRLYQMQRVLIISRSAGLEVNVFCFDFPFNIIFQVQRHNCREPCRDELLRGLLGGVGSKWFVLMFQLWNSDKKNTSWVGNASCALLWLCLGPLWVMEKIEGKNQCLVKHRSFCLKFFGSAVEVVFGNVHKAPSLGSAGALGHSQLSAKGRVFPQAKSHQLGSLFLLSIWWNWLRKVPFSPSWNHKFKASALHSAIFSFGKKSAFFHSKTSGWLSVGLNTQKTVLSCSRLSTPEVGGGPSLPFCLG